MTSRALLVAMVLLLGAAASCSSQSPSRPVTLHPADSTVTAIIQHADYDWQQRRTERAAVYYEASSFAAAHIEAFTALVEVAVARALEILHEPSAARGIRVFVLDSREKMKDFIGSTPKGYTLVGHDAVLLVFNASVRPYAHHEIFHAISIELWGFPPPWIREGGAVFADGTCLDYEDALHTIAGYLAREGKLLPLGSLIAEFMAAAAENDLIAYLQAGSVFQFVYETYGVGVIKKLWRSKPFQDSEIEGRSIRAWIGAGPASLEAAVGKPLHELEAEWLEYIGQPRFERDVDWDELMDKGCG